MAMPQGLLSRIDSLLSGMEAEADAINADVLNGRIPDGASQELEKHINLVEQRREACRIGQMQLAELRRIVGAGMVSRYRHNGACEGAEGELVARCAALGQRTTDLGSAAMAAEARADALGRRLETAEETYRRRHDADRVLSAALENEVLSLQAASDRSSRNVEMLRVQARDLEAELLAARASVERHDQIRAIYRASISELEQELTDGRGTTGIEEQQRRNRASLVARMNARIAQLEAPSTGAIGQVDDAQSHDRLVQLEEALIAAQASEEVHVLKEKELRTQIAELERSLTRTPEGPRDAVQRKLEEELLQSRATLNAYVVQNDVDNARIAELEQQLNERRQSTALMPELSVRSPAAGTDALQNSEALLRMRAAQLVEEQTVTARLRGELQAAEERLQLANKAEEQLHTRLHELESGHYRTTETERLHNMWMPGGGFHRAETSGALGGELEKDYYRINETERKHTMRTQGSSLRRQVTSGALEEKITTPNHQSQSFSLAQHAIVEASRRHSSPSHACT